MYSIYQVMFGDTLESIANKTNTTVDKLREINSVLNLDNGSYIIVPANSDDAFTMYIVKSGDNLYGIAREYNISVDDLVTLNGLNKNDYLYPNQEIMVPTGKASIYITKDGDTIDKVLMNFNTDFEELKRQNRNLYLASDQIITFRDNFMNNNI